MQKRREKGVSGIEREAFDEIKEEILTEKKIDKASPKEKVRIVQGIANSIEQIYDADIKELASGLVSKIAQGENPDWYYNEAVFDQLSPKELFDSKPLGFHTADMGYLPDEKLLLIPTFTDRVIAKKIVLPN